jgi:quercetin dioxygenase-like cupin family protein
MRRKACTLLTKPTNRGRCLTEILKCQAFEVYYSLSIEQCLKDVCALITVKREDAKGFSTIPGVETKILVTGEKQMLVLFDLEPTAVIPLHSHIHEQAGLCLRGTVEFQTENGPVVVEENMAYVFKSNEKHGCRPLSEGGATFLESFSPPREDFLALVQ